MGRGGLIDHVSTVYRTQLYFNKVFRLSPVLPGDAFYRLYPDNTRYIVSTCSFVVLHIQYELFLFHLILARETTQRLTRGRYNLKHRALSSHQLISFTQLLPSGRAQRTITERSLCLNSAAIVGKLESQKTIQ